MNYFEVTFKPTGNQLKFLLNSSIEIRLSVLFGQSFAQLSEAIDICLIISISVKVNSFKHIELIGNIIHPVVNVFLINQHMTIIIEKIIFYFYKLQIFYKKF